MSEAVNYGPLAGLIGVWKGNQGKDISPESDGPAENPYYETITFQAVDEEVENAESQVLTALHYLRIVQKKKNDEVFHHQTGYWMWDQEAGSIMLGLTIPRGVAVLAGGSFSGETDDSGRVILEVEAHLGHTEWGIIQSPFMSRRAKTTSFRQRILLADGELHSMETTMVDIYGESFEHTDANVLVLSDEGRSISTNR